MPDLLSAQVEAMLKETVESFPHAACLTCDCFLGLVAQLRIATDVTCRPLLEQYKVSRKEMQACLGCDPCPPGDSYAKYIRHKQVGKLIPL